MRHVLRRILWIVPTLFVISVASFWMLTAAAGWQIGGDDDAAAAHPLFGAHRPPRFFNPNPISVNELAERAMRSIAADDRDAALAKVELVRLGGAALPHVLPKLDALDPKGRARVALALAPLGLRMNVAPKEELESPESAILFWTRFWQDRGIDYRPLAARRAVQRLAQKSTAGRRDDVQHFDTYVLPELIRAMPPVDTEADVTRVRRLASSAARVTERPWRVPNGASVAETREVMARWQRFWVEHHSDYTSFDGAERVLAMVSETQYGRWAATAAETGLGVTHSGERVTSVFKKRAPVTLWLIFTALGAGYALGIVIGVVSAAAARKTLDLALTVGCVVGIALPMAFVSSLFAPGGSGFGTRLLAALLMTLTSACIVSRHQRSSTRVALDQEYTRTARAFGAGPWRIAFRSFRASSAASVSLLGADLPVLITAAFVVEHALGLPGLGDTTLGAVASRDIPWLMALALALATCVALCQIASDSLLSALDPRVAVAFLRKREGGE
jgi:ABC-type dipeptide/oligopeptide/nickel transport system permease component